MTQTRQVCLAALAAFLLIAPPSAQARQIVLAWDPSPEPTVTGYILFYGPLPGVYTTSVDVGNLISYQIDLPGTQYYFAVLGYNSMGLTSSLSNEVAASSLIVLMNPGDQNSAAGSDVSLPLVATGVPFSYTATNLPGGLGIGASTGQISGTISSGAAVSSPYLVTAKASDVPGNTSSVQFTWTVVGPPKTVPTITWTAPASITYGTALGAAQLNAAASVPGTFAYAPSAGTVLSAGAGQMLSVTFTPTDTANYTTATRSVSITVTPPATPVTELAATADLAAPQPPGTTITLTAAATGGTAPYQFKWWVFSATGWMVLQDWNAAASYAWTPTTPNPQGNVEVWVRSAGNSVDAPEKWVDVPFAILARLSVTADLATPQPPGTTITLTAAATGGTAPYQFKWWVFSAAGWTMLKDWSEATSYTWTPTAPNPPGTIEVWMRSAGNSADSPERWLDLPYAILGPPITTLTVSADLTAPQPPGTRITLTAAATGGTTQYQFKWWVLSATGWTVMQDWNAAPSYMWTPTDTNPQATVEVWVRSAGNSADAPETYTDMPYAIQ